MKEQYSLTIRKLCKKILPPEGLKGQSDDCSTGVSQAAHSSGQSGRRQ